MCQVMVNVHLQLKIGALYSLHINIKHALITQNTFSNLHGENKVYFVI